MRTWGKGKIFGSFMHYEPTTHRKYKNGPFYDPVAVSQFSDKFLTRISLSWIPIKIASTVQLRKKNTSINF